MKLLTPISLILKNNPFEVTFSKDEFEATEINECDIEHSLQSVNIEIDYKLKTGKCSRVLRKQLAIHRMNGYEKYKDRYHHYHYATIRDIMEAIEAGNQVNIRPFNGKILAGLKHFHHSSETFLKKNILNYWEKKTKGKNEIEYQNGLLSIIQVELKCKRGVEDVNEKLLQGLLNQIHSESNFRPFDKKTGEWVVFAELDGVKYYLCLATHDEPDEDIYQRILPCLTEFEELGDVKIGK